MDTVKLLALALKYASMAQADITGGIAATDMVAVLNAVTQFIGSGTGSSQPPGGAGNQAPGQPPTAPPIGPAGEAIATVFRNLATAASTGQQPANPAEPAANPAVSFARVESQAARRARNAG